MSDAKQRLALAVNQAIRPRMSLDQIKRLPLGVQLAITQEVDRVQGALSDFHVEIFHAADCPAMSGGQCNCEHLLVHVHARGGCPDCSN